MADIGRPEYTDEDYKKWLEDLMPFLKLGETLSSAIEDAGWSKHRTTIYEKYRLKDWFSDRVDAYRAMPGRAAHNILVRIVMEAETKQKQGIPLTDDDTRNVRFYAEKARSSQPYFVNRTETIPAQPIEDIFEELNNVDESQDELAETASQQMVETESPIQDKGQVGATDNVPPEPNPATPPGGAQRA